MPAASRDDVVSTYGAIMGEIGMRLTVLRSATAGKIGLDYLIARELAFLQLRMICELVALGCLIAHGDLAEVKNGKLRKEYAADRIMNRLGDVHPRFYPQPITMNGGRVTDLDIDHLSRTRLIELYTRCGGELHRGSLKRLTGEPRQIKGWPKELNEEARRISNLLNRHAIVLFEDSGAIFHDMAKRQTMLGVAIP